MLPSTQPWTPWYSATAMATTPPAPSTETPSTPPIALTLRHQLLAATGASVCAALVVNPLDVIKTRLQTESALLRQPSPATSSLLPTPLLDKWSHFSCPPSCPRADGSALASTRGACGAHCGTYSSTIGMFRKIVHLEGVKALWRGTPTHMLMAVPLVGIYMPLYENILAHLKREGVGNVAAPMVAGLVSRAVSVVCVGPLELLRTRQQAATGPLVAMPGMGALSASMTGGVSWSRLPLSSLWRGTSATLLRDLPFSALYWTMVESIRSNLTSRIKEQQRTVFDMLTINMIAGSVSGGLAAAITTPLDVVKTRMQTAPLQRARSVAETMREVVGVGGGRALFTGVGPRSVRAAPACAIVISSYEMLKLVLALET